MRRALRTSVLFVILFAPHLCLSNIPEVATFSIETEIDTIDFIRVSNDSQTAKPTILFIPGSLPMPLIINFEGNYNSIMGLNNFDYQSLCDRYNFILIGKPHTPLTASPAELNDRYCYVPDLEKPDEFDERYSAANYMENYVRRDNAVLEFLREQPWVKKDGIILLGHSQGTYEAIALAQENPDIAAVAYFCGNPFGRFSQFITEQVNGRISGSISEEKAFDNINSLYTWWQHINRNEASAEKGDAVDTWKSFSPLKIDAICNIEAPLYIAYGTRDVVSQMCVYLPVYLELAGKTNYHIEPFIGRGHNFEIINDEGRSDFEDMEWNSAVNGFIEWVEQL